MYDVIMKAFGQTVYMVIGSTIFSVILGFIPAIVLTVTAPDGLRPNKIIYGILDILVNVFRSFPFIILMVIVIPFTRMIAGKAIGTKAALVPLTISAIPFVARVIESALRSVDHGLIEAARSFGCRRPADHLPRILKRSSSGYPFRYHTDYDQPDRLQRNGRCPLVPAVWAMWPSVMDTRPIKCRI